MPHQRLHTKKSDPMESEDVEEGAEETTDMKEPYLQQILELEEKAKNLTERLLRQQAEMENVRRRAERDVENAHKFALERFVNELLPIVDNLERALAAHAGEDASGGSLLDGVSLTLKMFCSVLNKFGVQQVNPAGATFNPEHHQAVSTCVVAGTAPGTVVEVLQKGYLLNDRLVRPALVVVAG